MMLHRKKEESNKMLYLFLSLLRVRYDPAQKKKEYSNTMLYLFLSLLRQRYDAANKKGGE